MNNYSEDEIVKLYDDVGKLLETQAISEVQQNAAGALLEALKAILR